MTVTKEELQYIADHWLPYQYLHANMWGESLEKANPETYLAISRGATFVKKPSQYLTYIFICKKWVIKDIIYTTKTEEHRKIIQNYLTTAVRDWLDFMDYKTSYTYLSTIQTSSSILRYNIIEKLSHALSSSSDRIYTLE